MLCAYLLKFVRHVGEDNANLSAFFDGRSTSISIFARAASADDELISRIHHDHSLLDAAAGEHDEQHDTCCCCRAYPLNCCGARSCRVARFVRGKYKAAQLVEICVLTSIGFMDVVATKR